MHQWWKGGIASLRVAVFTHVIEDSGLLGCGEDETACIISEVSKEPSVFISQSLVVDLIDL